MVVIEISDVGRVLNDLLNAFSQGHIKGLVIAMMDEEDGIHTAAVGNLNYAEKLGLAEVIKQNLLVDSLEILDE